MFELSILFTHQEAFIHLSAHAVNSQIHPFIIFHILSNGSVSPQKEHRMKAKHGKITQLAENSLTQTINL